MSRRAFWIERQQVGVSAFELHHRLGGAELAAAHVLEAAFMALHAAVQADHDQRERQAVRIGLRQLGDTRSTSASPFGPRRLRSEGINLGGNKSSALGYMVSRDA